MGYRERVLDRHPLSYYRLGELKSSGVMNYDDDHGWYRVQLWTASLIDTANGLNGEHVSYVYYTPPAPPASPFPGMEMPGTPYVDDGNLAVSPMGGVYSNQAHAGAHVEHIGMKRFSFGAWFYITYSPGPEWLLPTSGYVVWKPDAYDIRIDVSASPFNLATISARVYGSEDTESAPFSLAPITKNAWHYVLLNVKNRVVELFLDGVLIGTGSLLTPTETVGHSNQTMYFATSGWSPYFPVTVDEVEIYDSDYSEDPDWYTRDWWNDPVYGIVANPSSGKVPLRTRMSLVEE